MVVRKKIMWLTNANNKRDKRQYVNRRAPTS